MLSFLIMAILSIIVFYVLFNKYQYKLCHNITIAFMIVSVFGIILCVFSNVMMDKFYTYETVETISYQLIPFTIPDGDEVTSCCLVLNTKRNKVVGHIKKDSESMQFKYDAAQVDIKYTTDESKLVVRHTIATSPLDTLGLNPWQWYSSFIPTNCRIATNVTIYVQPKLVSITRDK